MVQAGPSSRKRKFFAALRLAGLTQEQWRTSVYPVSRTHLLAVFEGEREASEKLSSAIDSFIAKYLEKVA